MKKVLSSSLALSMLVAATAYAGFAPGTGVNNSYHDLNATALAGKGYAQDAWGRVCVFCHTPHNAIKNLDVDAPLWNHEDVKAATKALPAYQWIAPANKKGTWSNITDPLVGPTRLCMACHDGVTAADSHGSANKDTTGPSGTTAMKASYLDGLGNQANRFISDLTVTHPVGFKYDDAQADRPAEIVASTNGFIAEKVSGDFDTYNRTVKTTTGKLIKDTLYGGYMTCASCHDVHNTLNPKGTTYNYFLYSYEEGSAICLSCHYK